MMQRSTVIAAGLCTIGSGLAQEIAVSIGCLYNPSLTQFISDRCDAAVYGVACTVLNDASPHVDKAFNDGQNAANGALLRQLEQLQVCIQGLTHQVTTVEAEKYEVEMGLHNLQEEVRKAFVCRRVVNTWKARVAAKKAKGKHLSKIIKSRSLRQLRKSFHVWSQTRVSEKVIRKQVGRELSIRMLGPYKAMLFASKISTLFMRKDTQCKVRVFSFLRKNKADKVSHEMGGTLLFRLLQRGLARQRFRKLLGQSYVYTHEDKEERSEAPSPSSSSKKKKRRRRKKASSPASDPSDDDDERAIEEAQVLVVEETKEHDQHQRSDEMVQRHQNAAKAFATKLSNEGLILKNIQSAEIMEKILTGAYSWASDLEVPSDLSNINVRDMYRLLALSEIRNILYEFLARTYCGHCEAVIVDCSTKLTTMKEMVREVEQQFHKVSLDCRILVNDLQRNPSPFNARIELFCHAQSIAATPHFVSSPLPTFTRQSQRIGAWNCSMVSATVMEHIFVEKSERVAERLALLHNQLPNHVLGMCLLWHEAVISKRRRKL